MTNVMILELKKRINRIQHIFSHLFFHRTSCFLCAIRLHCIYYARYLFKISFQLAFLTKYRYFLIAYTQFYLIHM